MLTPDGLATAAPRLGAASMPSGVIASTKDGAANAATISACPDVFMSLLVSVKM